ncbi:hypothetical protein GGI17_006192 [Coemansia sp. S146]|nr:hypothetical protein GGI17_006192 [Coemansia sp. S146]
MPKLVPITAAAGGVADGMEVVADGKVVAVGMEAEVAGVEEEDGVVGGTNLTPSNYLQIRLGLTPDTHEYKVMLKVLLYVCQNFRAVVSAIFYRVNLLDIGSSRDYRHEAMQFSYSRRLRDRAFIPVKRERLSRAPFDGWDFRNIRKLKLQFYVPQWKQDELDRQRNERWTMLDQANTKLEYYDWLDEKYREIEERDLEAAPTVKANINEFVCRIKQMVPTLREIELEYGMHEVEQDPGNDFFDTLLGPLLHLAPRIVHRTVKNKVDVKVSLDSISNLVHIDMEASSLKPIAQLARRNAATLEHLCIIMYPSWRVSALDLVKDAGGDYYGAIPILRTLSLVGRYLFDDDVLFRGNAATLESLVIKANQKDVAGLIELGRLTPTSHPKLQCVKVLYKKDYVLGPFASYTDYLRLLLSIAPNAAVRSLPYNESRPDTGMISIFGDYPNIQVLGLPEIYLSLWDAIALINSLPLLSDLHSRTSYILQLLANVKEKDLPAYMLSKYAPMGQRFRCWHITETCQSVTTTARCVLLLALICPNFDYCAPPKREFREYMDKLKMTIDSDGFKDHAPRLRRFLFNKWGY